MLLFPHLFFVDPSVQSCLLIIDNIMLPGVVSTEDTDLVQSLLKLNKNTYQPVEAPEFVPANFGEASRGQHLLDVVLTVLCNGENPPFVTCFFP